MTTGPHETNQPLPAFPPADVWLKESLELKAQSQDQRIVNYLLRNLVLKYAETERQVSLLNKQLQIKQAQLEEDLAAAGEIQRALVPRAPLNLPTFSCHWSFLPCDKVAGDVFQVYALNEELIAFYIIDVTGHGVPAAMVTASVSQFLSPFFAVRPTGPTPPEISPLQVLQSLEREFPLERFHKLFSIIYGVFHLPDRRVTFANAGHPYPVMCGGDGPTRFLEESGPLVGMDMPELFSETTLTLKPGEKLFFYSDGITECRNPCRELFGEDRLLKLLEKHSSDMPEAIVKQTEQAVERFRAGVPFADDATFFVLG